MHDPVHLFCRDRSVCSITGVRLVDSHFSDEITQEAAPGYRKALFSVGDGTTLSFAQSRAEVSNSVVNIMGWAYARIRFGWTYVDRYSGYPNDREDPILINADSGWSFAGNGGVVACSHTYVGDGVTLVENESKLTLLSCS